MPKEQWIKSLKGFAIAMAGAVLTYASMHFIPDLQKLDGEVWVFVAAFASTGVNVLRKLLAEYQEKDVD